MSTYQRRRADALRHIKSRQSAVIERSDAENTLASPVTDPDVPAAPITHLMRRNSSELTECRLLGIESRDVAFGGLGVHSVDDTTCPDCRAAVAIHYQVETSNLTVCGGHVGFASHLKTDDASKVTCPTCRVRVAEGVAALARQAAYDAAPKRKTLRKAMPVEQRDDEESFDSGDVSEWQWAQMKRGRLA